MDFEESYLVVNDTINCVFEEYKGQIEAINGEMTLDLEKDVMVLGTALYLNSIISNLISNAIKYRSESRPLSIKVKSYKVKNELYLEIKDNGRGINLEMHKERLFKMFNRFHDNVEGSGMGLYMAKGMIEKIGGSISLESKEGRGTTFYIKLKSNGKKIERNLIN